MKVNVGRIDCHGSPVAAGFASRRSHVHLARCFQGIDLDAIFDAQKQSIALIEAQRRGFHIAFIRFVVQAVMSIATGIDRVPQGQFGIKNAILRRKTQPILNYGASSGPIRTLRG
jgi:hypothetical protein